MRFATIRPLVCVLFIAAALAAQAPPTVEPFPLRDVRLLEGSRFYQAQELNKRSLLSYEPDRFLAWFRKEAGLESKGEVYGGWESRGIAGHTLGHYLTACSLMWASTGDERFKQRADYIVSELAAVQAANGNGYIGATPNGKQLFAEVQKGDIRAQRFDLNGGWVPIYAMHKVFAGLRDAYRYAGNKQALATEAKLADWLGAIVGGLNEGQMQRVLYTEHGGISETLADLYADTGEKRYLDLARRFHDREVLDAMIAGRDVLPGKHANTQIPKIVGMARIYEVAGDRPRRNGAEFFWDRVAHHHSYVTGGHCISEHFGDPDLLSERLGPTTTESCNVYNMLKLTNHLFAWDPRAGYADFYERALYNHILSTQHPETGRVIYNLSLEMGGAKQYQDPESMTCCVGSGMENHSKYGESVYFHNDGALYVNLFIASELQWREKGFTVRQETKYPDQDSSRLILRGARPSEFTLHIRYPSWAVDGAKVSVNGDAVSVTSGPGGYIALHRTWRDGDTVDFRFPMRLHLESMPDNPDRVAVLYGPLVLAGVLGDVNDPAAGKPDYVPALVAGNRPLADWVEAEAGQPNHFRTKGAGTPRDVELLPFYQVHDRRYSVYFDAFRGDDAASRETAYRVERRREADLDARAVDTLRAGESNLENRHRMRSENSRVSYGGGGLAVRAAGPDGWFSYQLRRPPEGGATLFVTYWSGEPGLGAFDVFLNDEKLASEEIPGVETGKYIERQYQLPAGAGEQFTLKFQGALALSKVRVVRN